MADYKPITDIAVALVTHMDDGSVDANATRAHVDNLVDAGVTTVVLQGTTGEGLYLSSEVLREQDAALHASNVRKIAGAIKPTKKQVLAQLDMVNELGSFESVLVAPYVDMNRADIFPFYREVSGRTDLPVIAYNIPGRTNCPLWEGTVENLFNKGFIAAVKDSGPKATEFYEPGMQHLCGNDRNQYEVFFRNFLFYNVKPENHQPPGAISGASNYIPFLELEQKILQSVLAQDYEKAVEQQQHLDYLLDEHLNVSAKDEPAKLKELIGL